MAEEQKASTSKVVIYILAIIAIMGAIAGIAIALNNKPIEENTSENISNPWTEYDSLAKLNDAFGVNLQHPGVMGISDESFSGMNRDGETMAQYSFTIAGYEYNLRASKTITSDISGIHVGETTLLDGQANDVVVTKDGYKGIQWKNNNIKYSLTVKDEGKISAEAFESMANEIKTIQQ